MTNDELATRIGTTIRELREMRGWSQKELAERVGYSQSSVCDWEGGNVVISLQCLAQVADAFDADASDILSDAGV